MAGKKQAQNQKQLFWEANEAPSEPRVGREGFYKNSQGQRFYKIYKTRQFCILFS